jgi:hypothetical protein
MRRLEIRMVPIRIRYITGGSIGHPVFLQIASRQRAEERTRSAFLSSGVMIEALQGFARACTNRISSRFLCSAMPCVAQYCVPGGVRVVSGKAAATVRQQVQWHALATFGATILCHRFLGVAVHCRIGLSKLISLLAVACCFRALRPEWCQKWCQMD